MGGSRASDLRARAPILARFLFLIVTVCVIVAIIIQDHTRVVPFGVFNTGSAALGRLTDACLVVAIGALAVQSIELATGRMSRAGGLIRGTYVSLFILNGLLAFADRFVVARIPASRLGQSYQLPASGRPPVILRKNLTRAPAGPCLGARSGGGGPRILFLGDSYTEGSGHARACNYPDVAEVTLRESWNEACRVVNAGLSGYGAVESLALLRWYLRNGCPVDAIVFNLFLENDLADNLPGTERRVVGGFIMRFPRSWFLCTFHPLNTRTFRWAVVATVLKRSSSPDVMDAVGIGAGPCQPAPDPLRAVVPFLKETVLRDLEIARRVHTSSYGMDECLRAVQEMRALADAAGVPFVVVLFPNRALVDPDLQGLMEMDEQRLAPLTANLGFVRGSLPGQMVVDMTPVLAGRQGMYRVYDTHLSDAGNILAGRFVGETLAATGLQGIR
ncbi:MAG: hypothetical protein OEX18_00320 [Candidatus Krumholzibacteria bacterium]|nr:hypothetical protein [Candidatus Krumholzibacteria bacterium]MDH4335706.1 hypothetical protein [Candidatus Krumholzibacteria bacterium]MDH5270051.1 hypothetical protein [Candidatus Krumholzibacteria bacterium]